MIVGTSKEITASALVAFARMSIASTPAVWYSFSSLRHSSRIWAAAALVRLLPSSSAWASAGKAAFCLTATTL